MNSKLQVSKFEMEAPSVVKASVMVFLCMLELIVFKNACAGSWRRSKTSPPKGKELLTITKKIFTVPKIQEHYINQVDRLLHARSTIHYVLSHWANMTISGELHLSNPPYLLSSLCTDRTHHSQHASVGHFVPTCKFIGKVWSIFAAALVISTRTLSTTLLH